MLSTSACLAPTVCTHLEPTHTHCHQLLFTNHFIDHYTYRSSLTAPHSTLLLSCCFSKFWNFYRKENSCTNQGSDPLHWIPLTISRLFAVMCIYFWKKKFIFPLQLQVLYREVSSKGLVGSPPCSTLWYMSLLSYNRHIFFQYWRIQRSITHK